MIMASLFGFLLGCTVAGSSVYTYLVQEYKASNDLLTDDIYVRAPLDSPSSYQTMQKLTPGRHSKLPLPD